VDITVIVNESTQGVLVNSATVSGDRLDPDTANNVASVSTTVAMSEITVTPPMVDFGRVDVDDDPPVPGAVTISNDGAAPLTLVAPGVTLSGPNSPEFAVVGGGDAGVIGPGEMRTVQIEFDPRVEGNLAADLVIPSDDLDEPITVVPLQGVGAQLGPTGLTTDEIVNRILRLSTIPGADYDLNDDNAVDAVDVILNQSAAGPGPPMAPEGN
jgi:hypothetical protein